MMLSHAFRRQLLVLGLVAIVGPLAGLADDVPGVGPFEPAVVIGGSARERGAAYGRRFGPAIRAFLQREIEAPFVGKPSSAEAMRAYAEACAQVIREECPMLADELAGIAEGAGLPFEAIVRIQLHEEWYHRAPLPASGTKPGHCTAVAIGPPATAVGATFVAQTWDWMPSVAGMSRVVEWQRDGDGASVLAYGFPGLPFGAGVNDRGLALCWTSAALGRTDQTPRVGLPAYTLIAHLLAQPDLDAAEWVAQRDRHAGWFTFVMADAQGNLLNIEGSPAGVATARSRGRLARVDYGSREMTGTATRASVALHPRCQAMLGLLAGVPEGSLDRERLQQFLADPAHGIAQGKGTIDLMVYDTPSRTAYLSRGPAYGVEWRAFRFRAPR